MVSSDEVVALLRKLEASFAEIPPPAEDRIALHDCDECRALREMLAGRRWRQIRPAELDGHCSLALLAPEAYRYYLPAYLMRALDPPYINQPHAPGPDDVCESILFSLAGPEPGAPARIREHWEHRFRGLLSQEQREAIAHFLSLVEEQYPDDVSKARAFIEQLATG